MVKPMHEVVAAISRRLTRPSETLSGYEQPELIKTILEKTKGFRASGDWPLMAGVSSVLDFGGGCGVHYKIAALTAPDIRWAVVETPAMVAAASELTTDNLQFFTSLSAAADWLGPIELMHSDGALQYTPDPEMVVRQLSGLGARKMAWYRILLSKSGIERNVHGSSLLDNGPGRRSPGFRDKKIELVETRISEISFLSAHANYHLTKRLEQAAGNHRVADGFEFHLRTS